MSTGRVARRTLDRALFATLALAALSCAALLVLGRPGPAGALGLGLALGSLNGRLVARTLAAQLPFSAMSLARLLLISTAAAGFGLLLMPNEVWLLLLGLGLAQLVLAATSAVATARLRP